MVSIRFVEVFCAVALAGNYARAAAQLGLTPAAISHAITRTEATLGVQLLRRTTRSMELTEAGRRYHEQCRRALSLLEEAERAVTDHRGEPRGTVRISVPTTYGHYRVLPMVGAFTARYPRVDLDVDVTNQNVPVIAGRFDLVVRMGALADSTLTVRRLEDAAFAVYASPDYLEKHGYPKTPDELDQHRCVTFVRPSTGKPLPWLFKDADGRPIDVVPTAELRCAGDVLACLTLARAGAALAQTYRYIADDDVRRGRLVEVLERHSGRSAPFSLLQPKGRPTAAVRAFADMLIERCTGAARA